MAIQDTFIINIYFQKTKFIHSYIVLINEVHVFKVFSWYSVLPWYLLSRVRLWLWPLFLFPLVSGAEDLSVLFISSERQLLESLTLCIVFFISVPLISVLIFLILYCHLLSLVLISCPYTPWLDSISASRSHSVLSKLTHLSLWEASSA